MSKKYILTKYDKFLEASVGKDEFTPVVYDREMLDAANLKIRRAIIWLNINKGFYANLLPYLNIYGSFSLNPKTMCTDGKSIIFHPEFVMQQSDGAIRFVLCHEILHCVMDHHTRRGNRHPIVWNIAADYAINPILGNDKTIEDGFEWPKQNGERIGLYEEKYDGMTAEDIYDLIIKDAKIISKKGGQVIDDIKQTGEGGTPGPDGPVVQTGEVDEDEGEEEEKEGGEEGQGGEEKDKEGQGGDGKDKEKEGKEGKEKEGQGGDIERKGKKDKEGQDGEGGEDGPLTSKEKGKTKGEKSDDESERVKTKPKVGQKVKLLNGDEAVIRKVYDNGDIEI